MADLVVTDPPYNVNYGDKAEFLNDYLPEKAHRIESHILNDNMDDESFYNFLRDFYITAKDHMREGAAIYVFHAESTGHLFREALLAAGLKLSQCIIWEKNTFVMGRQDYQWKHEPCLYGWKEGAAHYFCDDRTQSTVVIINDEKEIEKMKKPELLEYCKQLSDYMAQVKTSVIYENKPTKNDLHPTMKPIRLIGRLINNSSKAGWTVLDPFGGSGSTMMAAEETGRHARLMELDPKYCDVIVDRWEQLTGKKATRLEAYNG